MSVRSAPPNANHAHQLRADIESFRIATSAAAAPGAEITFDSLSEAEKSAATIGVSPDEWKPIGKLAMSRLALPPSPPGATTSPHTFLFEHYRLHERGTLQHAAQEERAGRSPHAADRGLRAHRGQVVPVSKKKKPEESCF